MRRNVWPKEYCMFRLGAKLEDVTPQLFVKFFPSSACSEGKVGKSFWEGLVDWIRKTILEEENNINEEDMMLFSVVDTAEEAVEEIDKFYSQYLLKPNF